MPNDKEVELEFPISGIDVTTEFQEQKPGTTPEAINVRAFDPIARRSRGGSRPGLAHYAPNPVPANAALDMTIQHLAVIVDPHATALPQNFITPGDDWVPDPLNPGTFVPPGGWGNPPNKDMIQPAKKASISGNFSAVSDPDNQVGCSSGASALSGSFSFTGLSAGTYDLVFNLGAFPPTEQIDYASITVGSGGGSIVNNGQFNCEIDGIVVAAGATAIGYSVSTKAYP